MKPVANGVLWSAVVLVLVVNHLCLPSVNGSSTVVKVEPATISVDVGEVFAVNITVLDVQNLYGVEVTLSWDPSILVVVDIDVRFGQSDGVLSNPVYLAQNETDFQLGNYVLAATSISPAPPFYGSGNVVRITFNATSIASSWLNLASKLYDYPPPDRWPRISLPIDHITIDGSFVVIPEFTNTAILLAFMAATSLIYIVSRRRFRNTSAINEGQRFKQGLLAESCVTTWRVWRNES